MSAPINPNLASDAESSPSSKWYAEQWERLCEVLEVTDPSEVVPRVQTLKQHLDQLDEGEHPPSEGLVTISEVEEVFHEMNEKMKTLRERNATLNERLTQGSGAQKELYKKTKQLLESLDASTMEEARQRIKKLNRRLVTLYKEKEHLAKAGFEDATEATEALDRLREERDRLQAKCERLEADRRQERQTNPSARPDPDTSVLEAAVAIRDTIGVTSPEEAVSFYKVIEKLYEQIRRRAEAFGVSTDEPSETVFDMLRGIAHLLRALPAPDTLESSGLSNELTVEVLGVATPQEVHSLAETAHRLRDQLMALHGSRLEPHPEADPSATTDVASLLRHLEEALATLNASEEDPVSPSAPSPNTNPPPSSNRPQPAEAPTLPTNGAQKNSSSRGKKAAQKSLVHQLQTLYREREILRHHDLEGASDAVRRLQTQRQQIETLRRENHSYERRFDRLEAEFGTARVSSLIHAVRTLENEANRSLANVIAQESERSQGTGCSPSGNHLEAAPSLLSPQTLHRLYEMSEQELDKLEVGLLQLDDDGTVEYANHAALQLPGLHTADDPQTLRGDNFFTELVPSAATAPFQGRFREGQHQEELDARFPYTIVDPEQDPLPVAIHLFRPPNQESTWLLFRSL